EAYVGQASQMDAGSNEGWSSGWRSGQSYCRDGPNGGRTRDTGSLGADTAGKEA
ncbi:unnamed protein product, partial [marine sediment metagenome]